MSDFTVDGLYLMPQGALLALYEISGDLRLAVRGRFAGQNLANEIARRGGLQPHASIRALVGMEDLRLPTTATLRGLAVGAGIPGRADAWITVIDRVRGDRRGRG